MAAADDAGGIDTSTNSGNTWIQTSAPASGGWSAIASSADGSKLAAASGGIYISTNSGGTWELTTAPSLGWYSIACSAEGTRLVAASANGVYNSIDSGVTWIPDYASGIAVASSADGTKLAVVGSGIWTAQATINSTTPGTTGFLSGSQNSAITLQYIGNGQWQPLNSSGTITANNSTNGPNIIGVFAGNGAGLTNLITPTIANYVHSYSTVTQAIATASTFQGITNNVDSQISGWSHTPGTVSYTNTQTGLYLVQYTAEAITTASVTTTASVRALDNGTEIPDSQSTAGANTANQTVPVSKSFIASFNSGDVLQFQFAGTSTDDRLVSNFGLGTTRPSFSCTIIRLQ